MTDLRISRSLIIPEHELRLSFARSGGPGGQGVNTSSSKVELRFDVEGSPSLSEEQKRRITAALATRMTKSGELVLHASEHRSQAQNRQAAVGRLHNLLAEALRPRRQRRATRPSSGARRRRLDAKRRQSEKKQLRRAPEQP